MRESTYRRIYGYSYKYKIAKFLAKVSDGCSENTKHLKNLYGLLFCHLGLAACCSCVKIQLAVIPDPSQCKLTLSLNYYVDAQFCT